MRSLRIAVIGAGAHRVSEIAGRIGRPASSLSRPLSTLMAMDFIRREIPFGSNPRSDKRSLYRLADPFLRSWFRVVAPNRAGLAESPRETRLGYWHRHRAALEAYAWEELCRMAVPLLHRSDSSIAALGPWEPARRYWRGNDPEFDVVARSVDGTKVLVGEVKWDTTGRKAPSSWSNLPSVSLDALPGIETLEPVRVMFVPEGSRSSDNGFHLLDARTVLSVLLYDS